MDCSVGAPGSTHDSRMLRTTSLYEKIISGNIPDKGIVLGDFRNIPLVIIGDTAFPKHAWLLKGYNENTRDPEQKILQHKALQCTCGYRKWLWYAERKI